MIRVNIPIKLGANVHEIFQFTHRRDKFSRKNIEGDDKLYNQIISQQHRLLNGNFSKCIIYSSSYRSLTILLRI